MSQVKPLLLNSGDCVKCLSKIYTPKHPFCRCSAESNNLPPQLPPRNFAANDVKDSEPKSSEQACKSLADTYLMRLQHMDMSKYDYICNICIDAAHRVMNVVN